MAYNQERRRGLYRKTKARKKYIPPPPRAAPPIDRNGLYPYLFRFTEWGHVKGLSPQYGEKPGAIAQALYRLV